jgi:peptide/nickel transport system ATP-binding protein
LVGESGSGKSTVALALTRYLPRNGRVSAGSMTINGRDVLGLNRGELRELRATTVSMVYQEPGRALNPSIRVGRQVAEVFEVAGQDRNTAMERAEAMLRKVQISDPGRVMGRYPHELSGGMAQRAVIAMALAAEPSLLILDEPTTALDATVEAEVLDLVAGLRDEFATSVLFISHNLAVIAKMAIGSACYACELVEQGPAQQVFDSPRHPRTVGLLRCIPRRGQRRTPATDTIPGFLPGPGHTLPGCVFAPRCPIAEQQCHEAPPPAFDTGPAAPPVLLPRAGTGMPRTTPETVALPGRPRRRAGAVRARPGQDLPVPVRGGARAGRRGPGPAPRGSPRPGR